jgi:hypothetical protein
MHRLSYDVVDAILQFCDLHSATNLMVAIQRDELHRALSCRMDRSRVYKPLTNEYRKMAAILTKWGACVVGYRASELFLPGSSPKDSMWDIRCWDSSLAYSNERARQEFLRELHDQIGITWMEDTSGVRYWWTMGENDPTARDRRFGRIRRPNGDMGVVSVTYNKSRETFMSSCISNVYRCIVAEDFLVHYAYKEADMIVYQDNIAMNTNDLCATCAARRALDITVAEDGTLWETAAYIGSLVFDWIIYKGEGVYRPLPLKKIVYDKEDCLEDLRIRKCLSRMNTLLDTFHVPGDCKVLNHRMLCTSQSNACFNA